MNFKHHYSSLQCHMILLTDSVLMITINGNTLFYSVLVTYVTCTYYTVDYALLHATNPQPNPTITL